MGKPTGFLEFQRLSEAYEPVDKRLKHYKEFVRTLSDDEAAKIQGARCMDCGIPFCNNGCPVNNIIPGLERPGLPGQLAEAIEVLHSTNNFPEFTGRICPAPCEAACTLNINADAGGHQVHRARHHRQGLGNGWVVPQPPGAKTGKKVAVVGSGPAGLARRPATGARRPRRHGVREERPHRRPAALRHPRLQAGQAPDRPAHGADGSRGRHLPHRHHGRRRSRCPRASSTTPRRPSAPSSLKKEFDAVVLAGGAESARPAGARPRAGRRAFRAGVPHSAEQGSGRRRKNPINAKGKHVLVIGGGDTGSDCVGTSNRHGAASITQIELMPRPPEQENGPLTWPYWPLKMRTSSSHDEGCAARLGRRHQGIHRRERQAQGVKAVRLEWKDGKMSESPVPNSRSGRLWSSSPWASSSPVGGVLDAFGVDKDNRGNAKATPTAKAATPPTWPSLHSRRVRRRRHAPRPVAGGLGHPRRPPVRARGRLSVHLPDGL
jgi:glutamate synthase (NADPH/NADH) small chain